MTLSSGKAAQHEFVLVRPRPGRLAIVDSLQVGLALMVIDCKPQINFVCYARTSRRSDWHRQSWPFSRRNSRRDSRWHGRLGRGRVGDGHLGGGLRWLRRCRAALSRAHRIARFAREVRFEIRFDLGAWSLERSFRPRVGLCTCQKKERCARAPEARGAASRGRTSRLPSEARRPLLRWHCGLRRVEEL